jgi:hypothetical protein
MPPLVSNSVSSFNRHTNHNRKHLQEPHLEAWVQHHILTANQEHQTKLRKRIDFAKRVTLAVSVKSK